MRPRNGTFHADSGLDPQLTFPTPADQAEWKAQGSPPLSAVGHSDNSIPLKFVIGGVRLTPAQLQALPTDPGQLRGWLHSAYQADRAGLDENSFIYAFAADILTTPTTGGTRAALYRILAELPGVQMIGAVQDPLGRAGTAIARTDGGKEMRRLIIDPKSGALLAQAVYASQGADAPIFWNAWRELSWTDQIGN